MLCPTTLQPVAPLPILLSKHHTRSLPAMPAKRSEAPPDDQEWLDLSVQAKPGSKHFHDSGIVITSAHSMHPQTPSSHPLNLPVPGQVPLDSEDWEVVYPDE